MTANYHPIFSSSPRPPGVLESLQHHVAGHFQQPCHRGHRMLHPGQQLQLRSQAELLLNKSFMGFPDLPRFKPIKKWWFCYGTMV